MSRFVLTWDEFKTETTRLAELIRTEHQHHKPTMIIALSRGGFIPARLLSDLLEVQRLSSIGIEYPHPDRSAPHIYSLPSPLDPEDEVLLVEDCLESGHSLDTARDVITPFVKKVRTCSLYRLQKTRVLVDFVVATLEEPPVFPWENAPGI